MVTKSGNVGDFFQEYSGRMRYLVTPVSKWMEQFSHIKDCTQVNFSSWGDLVRTVTMAGLRISDDKFVGDDFEGKKGVILYALTYKGQKVGYASDYPMIVVDSEVWK